MRDRNDQDVTPPAVDADSLTAPDADDEQPVPPAEESTVGTGTAIALGCVGLTVVIILVGIVALLVLRWLG